MTYTAYKVNIVERQHGRTSLYTHSSHLYPFAAQRTSAQRQNNLTDIDIRSVT
jgi:hypothetical protein